MATKKKKSTQTIKVNVGGVKKTFSKVSCSKKKTDATKKADNIRKKGGTARVVKQDGVHCVFKGPRAKKRKKK